MSTVPDAEPTAGRRRSELSEDPLVATDRLADVARRAPGSQGTTVGCFRESPRGKVMPRQNERRDEPALEEYRDTTELASDLSRHIA